MSDSIVWPPKVENTYAHLVDAANLFMVHNPGVSQAGFGVEDVIVVTMCHCKAFVLQKSQNIGKALPQLLYVGMPRINDRESVKEEILRMLSTAPTRDAETNAIEVIVTFSQQFMEQYALSAMESWGMISRTPQKVDNS